MALGIDLVADEVRNLLPDGADAQGPETRPGRKQDDHGAIAVESRLGCGIAGGVPVQGL